MLLLWPFAGPDLKSAGDLHAVVASVVEARNALREGQFPIRIAPNQLDGTRYPFFQFYANFPYTAAGFIDCIPGVGPYHAWKAVTFAALVCGGWYTYRCAILLTGRRRGQLAAVVASAAFMSAPYMLTDLFARGAFAELIAFNLLPALLFYALRTFRSPGVLNVIAAAVVWALIGLSHNITYLFASLFLAMFFLTFVKFNHRYARRIARLTLACVLQAALLAWYFIPQVYTLDALNITAEMRAQPQSRLLGRVPLGVMLAPTRTPPPTAPETALGLQIGWPIVAGTFLAGAAALTRRSRSARRRWTRGMIARFALLFATACLLAWSPFDFWRFLPEALRFVQFPYRLLAFATLFGSMLLAIGMATRIKLRPWSFALILGLVGWSASTYRPARLPGDPQGVANAVAHPTMGGLNDYLVAAGPGVAQQTPALRPIETGKRVRFRISQSSERRVTLPVLYYPRLLSVRVDTHPAAYERAGAYCAVIVPAGEHRIDAAFVGIGWANVVSAVGWTVVAIATIAIIARSIASRRLRRTFSARSVGLSLVGVAFFAAGMCCVPLYAAIGRLMNPPLKVTVSASRPSDVTHSPEFAFDDNPLTEWAAAGSDPITLTVIPARPAVLKRVELDARAGGLFEAWEFVRVDLFQGETRVATKEFSIPEAADRPVVLLEMPETPRVDRLEFHFDKPVTKLHDGRHVDARAVNPGYREIRLAWDR